MSKEVAAAFDAIRKTKDIKATELTAMRTQIETRNMRAILNALLNQLTMCSNFKIKIMVLCYYERYSNNSILYFI
jgi:uncharacterized protein YqgV (UPF0045/DUF77 family)